MGPQIMIEKEVFKRFPERPVVGDPLVELKVGIHDLLDDILDLVVEGETDIFPGVDPGAGVEGCVAIELRQDLPERYTMLRPEVQSESLVQLGGENRTPLRKRARSIVWAVFSL